jgi:hypothetical protein
MLTPRITEGWGKQRPAAAWLQSAFSLIRLLVAPRVGNPDMWAEEDKRSPNDRFGQSAWKSPVPFAASHAQTPLGRLNLTHKVSPATPI